MNRIVILFLLFASLSISATSQTDDKSFNLIIIINNEIATSNITDVKLVTQDTFGKECKIPVDYYPGDLSTNIEDLNTVLSDNITSIRLEFIEYRYNRKEQIIKQYSIDLKKAWLQDYYSLLRIYDLDIRKFKRRFRFVKNKNYVYELDSPCCTFRLNNDS